MDPFRSSAFLASGGIRVASARPCCVRGSIGGDLRHPSLPGFDARVEDFGKDPRANRREARLGVEPSTIRRRVKRLEDVLGLTLFERHSDGLRPTAASDPLLRHAREAARSIDTLLVTARKQPSAGGRIRVACTTSMADLVLIPNMQGGDGTRVCRCRGMSALLFWEQMDVPDPDHG